MNNLKFFFSRYLYIIPLLLFSVLYAFDVASIPSTGDDILYEYYYPEIPVHNVPHGVVREHPIENLLDISESIYHHYFNMNGRAPVHYIVQLFCGVLGKKWYAVVSAVVLFLFSLIIGHLSGFFTSTNRKILLLLPVLLIFVCVKEPNVFFGVAGGVNYLWASTVCLLFWLLFTNNGLSQNLPNVLILGLLSFFAGWSHEGIVIPLSISCLSFFVRRIGQFSRLQYLMGLCFIIGASFLVFAPSNFNRAGDIELSQMTFASFFYCFKVMGCFYVMCILLLVYHFFSKKSLLLFFREKENIDIFLGIIGGIVVFSFVPNKVPRISFGMDLLSTIISCRIISSLLTRDIIIRRIGAFVSALTILGMSLILCFQQFANNQIMDLKHQLEISDAHTGVYYVQDTEYPHLMSRYILKCCSGWKGIYNDWNRRVFSWAYNKPVVAIGENKDKNCRISGASAKLCGGAIVSDSPIPSFGRMKYRINYDYSFKYQIFKIKKLIFGENLDEQKEWVFSSEGAICEGEKWIFPYFPDHWIVDEISF